MFGYVRPCKPELKCRELDLYKATYCGLCCTLRQRYGMIAPMFLSYDMTFLALLLEQAQEVPSICKGRCHANLLLKKTTVESSDALNLCADYTVILAWFQLKDTIHDDGFFKILGAQFLCVLLAPSYKKAMKRVPYFEQSTAQCIEELHALEQGQCESMDKVAHCFASILQETVPSQWKDSDSPRFRSLRQMLYHVGRWIYLLDARDDFLEDKKSSSYNPLLLRFGETGNDEALASTLNHSLHLARSAQEFLDLGIRTGTVENILSLGLPLIQESVFQNNWKQKKRLKTWRKS